MAKQEKAPAPEVFKAITDKTLDEVIETFYKVPANKKVIDTWNSFARAKGMDVKFTEPEAPADVEKA
jgi:hypothetical protein